MAIAGRVAIVPKGDYDSTVAYQKLDLVRYNHNVYIAKKSSTGILPTDEEYWMLAIENVTQEQYEAIVNGTTTVGKAKDADTVDGYHVGGNGLKGLVALDENYGIMEVGRTIDFHTADGQDFKVRLACADDGNLWLNFPSGEAVRLGTTADLANYLPLDGSVPMSGALKSNTDNQGVAQYFGLGGIAYVDATSANGGSRRQLRLYSEGANTDCLDILNVGTGTIKTVLHTGNKPTGSYTGNGSAESRTVNTGGVGNTCIIYSITGTTIVTSLGGVCINPSNVVTYLGSEIYRFYKGILTISTDSDFVNRNAETYLYQVL